MNEFLVVFTPSGRRGVFAEGTSVLAAARALGVDLDSVCGGRALCGRCQVVVAEGRSVTPPNAGEERHARLRGFRPDRRLGCQAHLCGALRVDIPPDSQIHRQVLRKRAEARDITLDPVVTLHYVEVQEPDMHDPASDFRRLRSALAAQWGFAAIRAPLAVLRDLQKILRAGDWRVTAAIRRGGDLVALYPGLASHVYGLAVDVGSTTIAAHLCDLMSGAVLASNGVMNPQIRFGEDLMSRVAHIMMNKGGDRDLTDCVRAALRQLTLDIAGAAKVALETIVEVTVVGNPIMHHLLLGLDPTELGGAPFALTIDEGFDAPAQEIGLPIAPGAFAFFLPCIAGHVGADTAAVVLSEAPHETEDLRLLVDVGTNAEIVLGNRQRLLACSSPTGPAFEGAQISSGQRAAPGAIERIRVDRATLEPRFQVVGSDLWSDDPAFAHKATGLCGSAIIEVVVELLFSGIITREGVIDGACAAAAAKSPRIVPDGRSFAYVIQDSAPRIAVTQNDIRAIQLAKAALHAGIKLLMDRYGTDHVDRITLAGAFGSHIDPAYAMALGLIPDCALKNVVSAGNAAGTGARIALLNFSARGEIGRIAQTIEKVETALEPAFQAHFVAAMAIPHASDRCPNVENRFGVTLPSLETTGRERRRRPARG